jgi:branched-chain amino acid transport system ATP-binding protein
MQMLTLSHVNAGYGTVPVLHDVSLTVEKGEIVCLLGSNGAGKSTTLLTIIGILTPTAGSISFNGTSLVGRKTSDVVRSGIAIVPEGRRVFGPMTVLENLMIAAAVHAQPLSGRDTLDMVFELFPVLRERQKQLSGTLSGGQQQMLAIGRALMTHPQLILMDEPSMGLSPLMCDEVFDTIEMIRKHGVSILLVEQNAEVSLGVASRGYVLAEGEIAAAGPSHVLRDTELVREAYL